MLPAHEDAIARFEDAWQTGRKPAIAAVLRDAAANTPESAQRSLAIELVKVDLEYRWRAATARGRPTALRLEAYAGRLPILGPLPELPLDLIAEEYRVRRRFGDAPEIQEYFARFTHPRADLAATLEAVSRELSDEGVPLARQLQRAPRPVRLEVDPQAPLFHGDFVLKRQIGSGGLCRVYAGLQLSLGKEVAIKVLRRRYWNSGNAVDGFLREAQIVAQLPREGIVGIHGLGRLPRGGYFMVMDLVDGLDLRARRNAGEISPGQAAQWVAAAAEIVQRVHAAGYIHGDLKPANILVEYGGRVLLTDFGFARELEMADTQRHGEITGGTLAFVAPEVATDKQPEDWQAIDVFGLGAVLFWLLSGQAVHEGQNTNRLFDSLALPTWDAQVRERIPATAPASLVELCRQCLARNAADRPQIDAVIEQCRHGVPEADESGA